MLKSVIVLLQGLTTLNNQRLPVLDGCLESVVALARISLTRIAEPAVSAAIQTTGQVVDAATDVVATGANAAGQTVSTVISAATDVLSTGVNTADSLATV